jgi:hypothetical protein
MMPLRLSCGTVIEAWASMNPTDKETEDVLDAPEREEDFCVARYPYIVVNAADYDIVGGIVKALEVHGVPEHKCHAFIIEALAAKAADEADDAEDSENLLATCLRRVSLGYRSPASTLH